MSTIRYSLYLVFKEIEIDEVDNESVNTNLVFWPNSEGEEGPPSKSAKISKTCVICLEEMGSEKSQQ